MSDSIFKTYYYQLNQKYTTVIIRNLWLCFENWISKLMFITIEDLKLSFIWKYENTEQKNIIISRIWVVFWGKNISNMMNFWWQHWWWWLCFVVLRECFYFANTLTYTDIHEQDRYESKAAEAQKINIFCGLICDHLDRYNHIYIMFAFPFITSILKKKSDIRKST